MKQRESRERGTHKSQHIRTSPMVKRYHNTFCSLLLDGTRFTFSVQTHTSGCCRLEPLMSGNSCICCSCSIHMATLERVLQLVFLPHIEREEELCCKKDIVVVIKPHNVEGINQSEKERRGISIISNVKQPTSKGTKGYTRKERGRGLHLRGLRTKTARR